MVVPARPEYPNQWSWLVGWTRTGEPIINGDVGIMPWSQLHGEGKWCLATGKEWNGE